MSFSVFFIITSIVIGLYTINNNMCKCESFTAIYKRQFHSFKWRHSTRIGYEFQHYVSLYGQIKNDITNFYLL